METGGKGLLVTADGGGSGEAQKKDGGDDAGDGSDEKAEDGHKSPRQIGVH